MANRRAQKVRLITFFALSIYSLQSIVEKLDRNKYVLDPSIEPAKSVYSDMFSTRLTSCNLLCFVFLEPRLPGSDVKKLQKRSSKRLKREKKGVGAH